MDDPTFISDGKDTVASGAGEINRRSRPPIVLLAEDEPDIRYLTTLLLQQAGYEVIAVGDGEAAVQEFAKSGERVDFLLFDLIMPQKNGWTAYCEISEMRPGIPHLFMSGFMGNVLQDAQLAEDLEQLVIRKPFTPFKLLSKLEERLGRNVRGDLAFE